MIRFYLLVGFSMLLWCSTAPDLSAKTSDGGYFFRPDDVSFLISNASGNQRIQKLLADAGQRADYMTKVPVDLLHNHIPGMPFAIASQFQYWCRDSTTLLGDMGKYFNSKHSMDGYTDSASYKDLFNKASVDYFRLRNWMMNNSEELDAMFKTLGLRNQPTNAVAWRCNYKGVLHKSPENCAFPGLGAGPGQISLRFQRPG